MSGPPAPVYDAVVLAGGGARRLGGVDKCVLEVGGRRLLDRVLDAVADASVTVVVGPQRPVDRPVRWAREDPPGGGPAAALAAGLALVHADLVAVLAGDMPFLTADVLAGLRDLPADAAGAVLVDTAGSPQWLAGVWRTAALRMLPLAAGASLRATLGSLRPCLRPAPQRALLDCDTPDDVAAVRGLV